MKHDRNRCYWRNTRGYVVLTGYCKDEPDLCYGYTDIALFGEDKKKAKRDLKHCVNEGWRSALIYVGEDGYDTMIEEYAGEGLK